MEQTRLFQEETPAQQPGKTFLSTNAAVFNALCKTPTLQDAAKRAIAGNYRKHGDSRNAAAPFEDAFKDILLDPATNAQLGAELEAEAAAAGITISEARIAGGRDKTLADVILHYTGPDGAVAVATNIKRLLPGTGHTEGGSILSFLRLALDPTYDPAAPPTTRGYAWEQTIVEWLAGRHKIQPGRDYLLLCVYAKGKEFEGIEAWPVISGMTGNRPSAARHPNRAVLDMWKPTGTIPAGYDINRHLAQQLLPAANPGAARALLTALAIAVKPDADPKKIARAIGQLDDSDIAKVAKEALT